MAAQVTASIAAEVSEFKINRQGRHCRAGLGFLALKFYITKIYETRCCRTTNVDFYYADNVLQYSYRLLQIYYWVCQWRNTWKIG